MSFEWFVAKRYLWSRRRHPFAGVMATISVLGIAVGVAALIVVMGVMSGFDEDLKSRIIGVRAHLVVEADGPVAQSVVLAQKLRKVPGVSGVSGFVEGQALVQVGSWGTGVLARGIDPRSERTVSRFFKYLSEGTLSDKPDRVVIGSELARRAGLRLGSEIQIATQQTEKPQIAVVEGIFSSGMYEYDSNLIFLNLISAQKLFGLGENVSGLSVYLKDAQAAPKIKEQVVRILGYPYYVRTWMDLNRTLFSALALEKLAMFLILALIILVACLNIAGSLTIIVMDKTRDIGVLKTLGATPASLMRVFAIDGALLGGIGSLAGFVIGTGLCIGLKYTKLIELPKDIYYGIDRLPVSMNLADSAFVVALAVMLSLASAVYPASLAAKLDPVKALRYE